MDLKELYPAFKAASDALASTYNPILDEHAEKYLVSRQQICLLTTVPTYEPKSVNPALLNIRSPYTAPARYRSCLSALADAGLLSALGSDQYRITGQGLDALKQTLNVVYNALAGIQPVSVTKMMDLASRLKELADACMSAPNPPGTWCIQHTRRMDPGPGNPMMVRIDQFLHELLAFREDAHLAAWRHHECSGHAWDILTLLWVELEGTVEEVGRRLEKSGFTIEETTAAVDYLLSRDWLSRIDGHLRITTIGAEVRHKAEALTDRFYIERFSDYSTVELARTLELVKQFRRGLKT